ncbi:unnamed protein product [Spirodela intermedia]|uniref:Reverse transcriptase Ty1/copia-type domain-containing protein n=1 Tax=Spirodela intermedia TaxID=51605 RepID=A0A7I8J7R9_SPIIN|nr:unnamed protein product [Spirodela intermedia]CAA6665785.1 unnamed protein product [Spirodela intermedia]
MFFKKKMSTLFKMIDLGLLSSYLEIQVSQLKCEIILSQKIFVLNILKAFEILNCNQSLTPLELRPRFNQIKGAKMDLTLYKSLMGSLKYLTHTRPDLLFNVGFLNRYMDNPTFEHLKCAKRMPKYVKGTLGFELKYKKGGNFDLKYYCDNDYDRETKGRAPPNLFLSQWKCSNLDVSKSKDSGSILM